ncbi:7288_t:CDS:1 [Diversispora eburnea]|uniref:7288_t:CDS:1 n=1 Tax=Diversispora eburnea TaxID=1213867 RepID=A0A9N8ZJ34_9GLOM|nr:7288_t:CDS:1 [Diversispora eburnea]
MVQKHLPRQEQTIYSPYYYPNFSRYNYPAKIGGDEEIYTEPKFTFPHWDDEVSGYAPPNRRLRRRASSPEFYEDLEEYFIKSLHTSQKTNNSETEQEVKQEVEQEVEQDEGESNCEKIQVDIELARRDQKTDYDQFRKVYANLDDDIRALQREIEEFEAACMARGWGLTSDNEDCVRNSELTTETVSGSLMAAVVSDNSGRPLAVPSATAAAAERRPPTRNNKNRINRSVSFSGGSTNGNGSRCLGLEDGWTQERVHHQNEWIRC